MTKARAAGRNLAAVRRFQPVKALLYPAHFNVLHLGMEVSAGLTNDDGSAFVSCFCVDHRPSVRRFLVNPHTTTKGTVPAYKLGDKVILRAASWEIIQLWQEKRWNKAGTKLTKVKWVRLRRDQDFYEESRPVRGKPALERKG